MTLTTTMLVVYSVGVTHTRDVVCRCNVKHKCPWVLKWAKPTLPMCKSCAIKCWTSASMCYFIFISVHVVGVDCYWCWLLLQISRRIVRLFAQSHASTCASINVNYCSTFFFSKHWKYCFIFTHCNHRCCCINSVLVGELVGARLIAHAGSLMSLAK